MKLQLPEKRDAICYARVKASNKKWLLFQAKANGLNLSPTLDLFLDKLRKQYPIKKKA